MPRQFRALTLPIEFWGTEASSVAAKAVLRLEHVLAPWFPDLPEEVEIASGLTWNQSGPPATGDIKNQLSWGIDHFGHYVADSGFPAVEKCWPSLSSFVGSIYLGPGGPTRDVLAHDPPLLYRRDQDCIVVAPNVTGCPAHAFQVFLSVGLIEPSPGFFTPRPGVVFRSQMNFDRMPDANTFSLRSLVPAIATGGNTVRVHVGAWRSGMSPSRMSIGKQSGTGPDMAAAPVPLTLNGNPNLPAVAPYGGMWIEAPLATQPGDNLIVHVSMFNATNGWANHEGDAAIGDNRAAWHVVGVDRYAEATMPGATFVNRTAAVDCVEIL